MIRIGVLGAGAWGTALAIHLARAGHVVTLWTHRADHAAEMAEAGENGRYLPGIPFPDGLEITNQLQRAVEDQEGVLSVVPSHAFAEVLTALDRLKRPLHFAWATKGFDPGSHRMLHQVVEEHLNTRTYAVVSGPSFAHEVARGLPTALVSASFESEEARWWAECLHYDMLRVYMQDDVPGVEIGGAYKNVMAIAAGISDGLGMGANGRAALIARGLAEMIRFGVAWGGRQETFMGLTGVGDLVLTCTDDQSRNRRFGQWLAQFQDVEQARRKVGQVVEGVRAAAVVKALAEQKELELPIAEQVHAVVQGVLTPQQAVTRLFERDLKAERLV